MYLCHGDDGDDGDGGDGYDGDDGDGDVGDVGDDWIGVQDDGYSDDDDGCYGQ